MTGLRRKIGSGGLALLLALGSLAAPSPASGQTAAELNKARAQYRQGLSLEAAGDWAGALAKFEQVAKVKLTPQVRFHIARSKEHLGRLNEALGDYRLAEYEAEQAGAKELSEIRSAREALEARIPKLVIKRGPGAEKAKIELDGVELGSAKVGSAVAVDPGTHGIVAIMPGGGEFMETVSVDEGETKEVELVPPDDMIVPSDDDGGSSSTSMDDDPVVDTGVQEEEEGGSALPWVIGGIGAASLVASGVFYSMRNSAEADLEDGCRGDVCPQRLESTQSDGETYTLLTNVTLGVGIVGLGTAAILLLSGGSSDAEEGAPVAKQGISLQVVPSKNFEGVNVVGRF